MSNARSSAGRATAEREVGALVAVLGASSERIIVTVRTIVSISLTGVPDAGRPHAHRARPGGRGDRLQAERRRPSGGRSGCTGTPDSVGRALATYEIPIEGRDEWLAAAGLSA